MENQYEFEEPSLLSVIAVGVPGKRTFFLAIGEKEEWVRLWLEKEQLEALALGIDQFLVTLSQEFQIVVEKPETQSLVDDVPSGLPSGEFEIEQIGIGFDQDKSIIEFLVHVLGPQRVDEISVSCRVTPSRVKRLGEQAKDVCAAGRPRCELCGGPIDPTGHDCPMQN